MMRLLIPLLRGLCLRVIHKYEACVVEIVTVHQVLLYSYT